MKVVKNINNNVAICIDSAGNEIVAFGKGIGYGTPPYDYDIKKIERTFYDVDKSYLNLINDVDEKIISLALDIRDYATKKGLNTVGNLLFSLIDHINFAVERQKKGILFTLPIKDDIRYKFEDEMEVGKFALKLIRKRLNIIMPKDEACYIALNIIASETEASKKQAKETKIIKRVTEIVRNEMNVDINEESVNYSRFSSHMHYILNKGEFSNEDNYSKLLNTMIDADKNVYECALTIKEFLSQRGYGELNKDEILFLTLHISRLCQRENK